MEATARETSRISLHQLRLLNLLNETAPPTEHCPVQSGFPFYKWLMLGDGPELRVPIPLTYISSDSARIFNRPSDGVIVHEKIDFSSARSVDSFVSSFVDSLVASSANSLNRALPLPAPQHIVVGVLKTPLTSGSGAPPSMKTELLFPLSAQAYLLNSIDKPSIPMIIQAFVKSRGPHASVYRIRYSSHHDESNSASHEPPIKGWNISCISSFLHYESAAGVMEEGGKPLFATADDVREFVKTKPHLEPALRDLMIAEASDATYTIGSSALCSLTDHGQVTPASCARVVVRRVHPRALNEPQVYLDCILKWIQAAVYHKESLLLSIANIVCDFIRDDAGVWWLMQLKSLHLNSISKVRIIEWHGVNMKRREKALLLADSNSFEVDDDDAEEEEERRKVEIELAKLNNKKLEKAGHLCRLCGLYHIKNKLLNVELKGAQVEVESYGYKLSGRLAVEVAELYRDNNVPLTETATLLLFCKASNALKDSQLMYTKFGEIVCCYYCFKIWSSSSTHKQKATEFQRFLGIPLDGRSASNSQENIVLDDSSLKLYSTLDTVSSSDSFQWRLLFMFNCIMDIHVSAQDITDSACCMSYTLGNRVTSITFANTISETEEKDNMTIPIKLCRLHYVFGNSLSLRHLFSKKRIPLHLFFSPTNVNADEIGLKPVYEGVVNVSLERMRWQGLTDGTEKIDLEIPIQMKTLGHVSLKLSVGTQ